MLLLDGKGCWGQKVFDSSPRAGSKHTLSIRLPFMPAHNQYSLSASFMGMRTSWDNSICSFRDWHLQSASLFDSSNLVPGQELWTYGTVGQLHGVPEGFPVTRVLPLAAKGSLTQRHQCICALPRMCHTRPPPAEREVMEACVRQLETPSLSAGVRDLLAPLVTLFAAASVERELSWYMAQEVVPVKVSTEMGGCCTRRL